MAPFRPDHLTAANRGACPLSSILETHGTIVPERLAAYFTRPLTGWKDR